MGHPPQQLFPPVLVSLCGLPGRRRRAGFRNEPGQVEGEPRWPSRLALAPSNLPQTVDRAPRKAEGSFEGASKLASAKSSAGAPSSPAQGSSTLNIVKAQLVFLLSTLTEDAYAKNEKEIHSLIQTHGAEAEIHLIKRLILAAAPAFLPLTVQAQPASTLQAPLALRLLISETKRLARDPAIAPRFRIAIATGLYDPSPQSQTAPLGVEVFRHFDFRSFVRDTAQLAPLETLVLCQEVVQILERAPAQGSKSPNKQAGFASQIGLAAATLLREAWPGALEVLSSTRSSEPASKPENLNDIGPMQVSSLFEFILSDFFVTFATGEGSHSRTEGSERLVSEQQQQDLVRAFASRFNSVDLVSQICAHAVDTLAVDQNTTATAVINRLCPDPTFCTVELARSVLARVGGLGNVTGDAAYKLVLRQFMELLDAANRDGKNLGVDILAWTQAIGSLVPTVPWSEVVRSLDSDSQSLILEEYGLRCLAAILATEAPHAVTGLWSVWHDVRKQIDLLERMLLFLPNELLLAALQASPEATAVSLEQIMDASPTVKQQAHNLQGTVWNSLQLVHILLHLSDLGVHGYGDVAEHARELLQRGVQQNPELVLIALVAVAKPWSMLHTELCAQLLSTFFNGHGAHQLVFYRIWQLDNGFLTAAIRDYFSENELNVTRVVDIAQELGIVEQLLDLKPLIIALDIAALASRRDLLQLDKWLQSSCQTHGPPFVRAILDILGVKVRYELERTEKQEVPPATMVLLPGSTVASFLRAARMNSDSFTAEDTELFKEVRQVALQLHPRLMNFAPNADGREPGTFYQTFSADIEAEGDVLFRQLYDGEASVEDVLSLLQRARESQDSRSINFFSYVLCALYEEKRFFSTYPEKELTLTAQLFGSLIENRMIEHIPLGIAVRYILDALQSPPESSWLCVFRFSSFSMAPILCSRFGVEALSRFHSRLSEWPQFAKAIAGIGHLQHTHAEILTWARDALATSTDETSAAVQQTVAANGVAQHQIFSSLGPDPTIEPESIEDPDEDTADRIGFIMNNLSQQNLQESSKELNERLPESIVAWAGKYIVEQRVSIEPNHHKLYVDLLSALDRPTLSQAIIFETFTKSAVLLNAEKTAVNSTERSVLKNLGTWLGLMTLAKNKPILQRNASFKDLLLQGYDNNRLIVIIPFVCKVLEQSAASRIFKPPNPWLMGILRLLVELYYHAEIKLNLKFEIEVLCKNLKIELSNVAPSTTVRERAAAVKAEQEAAAARSAAEAAQAQQSHTLGHLAMQPIDGSLDQRGLGAQPFSLGQQANYAQSLADSISVALQILPSEMILSQDIVSHFPPPRLQTLRGVLIVGIDRAIREIIAPVVERSVTIAGIATRELTAKDFAMEGDEEKLGKSAHLMVQNLAANLANVTCKDPLRISMITNIRQMLANNGLNDALDDTRLGHLVQDNLDVACQIVENVAKEKALQEVDEALGSQYLARRKHRERSTQPFWDSTAMAATHYSGMLPDALRIKLGGLSDAQLHVYEDFGRIRSGLSMMDGESPMPPLRMIPPAARPLSPGIEGRPAPATVQFSIAQVTSGVGELEGLLSQASAEFASLAQLPQRHVVFTCMDSISADAQNSVSPEDSLRAASSKVVQMLYRAETALAREAYVVILERLCMMSTNVLREVTGWFTYAEDERKLSVPVLMAVASRNIMDVGRFDGVLSALITREWRSTVLDFAAQFIARCLVAAPPIASREQLVQTLDALVQAAESGKATDLVIELLEDLRGSSPPPSSKQVQPEQNALRERLTAYFVDWVKIFQHSSNVDKSFVDFVTQLQTEGVLRGEEISSMFFRVCTEVSIEAYIKNKAAGAVASDMIFVPIDSLARLIALLVKYHADPSASQSDAAKVLYVNKVLSIVVLVLAHNHEEFGLHFQQKPFFRFFSSLLSNLHVIETYIGLSCYQSILSTLANQIQTLQPVYFPGFAFSWLSLVSHRLYMPRLLDSNWSEGNTLFSKHLLSMLRFLGPFLRRGDLQASIETLYFGFLKVVLILLHDFPDFLSLYAPLLVEASPVSCIQMINVFTSAFPSSANLPDPFSEGMDSTPEMSVAPAAIVTSHSTMPSELKMMLDRVLETGTPAPNLANRFLLPEATSGDLRYNYSLFDMLMQHVCTTAVGPSGKIAFGETAPSVILIEQLMRDLDIEGRYLVVSSAANLLRWPSAHTRFAKMLLCHLYGSAPDYRETVARVLLERLLVARPHPWGIVWAMSALIRQNLAQEEFVQKHEEMAALVQKIEKSLH